MRNLLLAGIIALTLTACSYDKADSNDKAGTATSGETAKATEAQASTPDGSDVIRVSVPSMQCETCAKTIKKALKEVEGAGDVNVDVDEKAVFVHVLDNTPAMKNQIEHAISDAGYRTEHLDRNKEAYELLDDCCKEGEHDK